MRREPYELKLNIIGDNYFQIESKKLEWSAKSKIGSMDNARHRPGGGDKKVNIKVQLYIR